MSGGQRGSGEAGGVRHVLVPAARPAAVPVLDEHQRRVVDHPGGPLLVLAGPGTGKTTTLVEAIVDRVERRGAPVDSVLALTFGRKAAEQLRDRVTARLGRTTTAATAATFHSFAYGLVRAYAPAELYAGPLRLLSAPEQDVVLRELLRDTPESVRWPESLRRARDTRGFAREVHDVLARAREKGLDPAGLQALGEDHDLPELVAAGLFLDQYLTILDDQGATDYADLVRRAVIEAEAHREELRARFTHVFVDEYQDTDPGQVALLRALAGDGRDLTVVGDPHQSIYAFRGAEVRGILDFPAAFPRADGTRADVVALRHTRRFGIRVSAAAQRVATRLPLWGSIDPAARAAFLAPEVDPGRQGRVEVLTFDSERAESEHLADLLRRAHLEDGVAWHDMVVLVRSGRGQLPGLRRALVAAGVPVEVAGDELPLVLDPAVAPLLEGLRAALNLANDDPEHPEYVDAARAEALLHGPLCGLHAGAVRRLARQLRARDRERVEVEGGAPAPSRMLLRRAVLEPGFVEGLGGPDAAAVARLNRLLVTAAQTAGTAEEALWALWSGTPWPDRLRRAAASGGAAARRAHRDLDAVVALFEAAARAEGRRDHQGVRPFLATLLAQRIPADTLAEQGVRGSAVRLLTAHRSKGLEWRLVAVAHVQDQAWPDLRRRSSLLGADRIGTHELLPPVTATALLAEERRLFYVACTRARERLVVTAVAASDEEGEQPSRFLDELGVDVRHVRGRPPRPLSMAGLVADLRAVLCDPARSPALREAAARRLARLAALRAGDRDRLLVPAADPSTWWGTRSATAAVEPLRAVDRPVPISASVLAGVLRCPLQWFLEREAGGVQRSHQAANIGTLVHTLADRVAKGEIVAGPDDVDLLMAEVDKVWDRLEFRTPWSRAREHDRVRAALHRFLRWHHADLGAEGPGRTLLATERHFDTVVTLPGGEQVRLTGYADRLELDHEGRVVVVDLKTGRRPPSGADVRRDPQLALYQLAVDSDALDELVPAATAGGAELVQLGDQDLAKPFAVQVQPAPSPDGEERADLLDRLAETATLLRTESFPAMPGRHCEGCPFRVVCPVHSAGAVVDR
ncbi:MAG: ATP-dependent helicase [Marmoricola sp.]